MLYSMGWRTQLMVISSRLRRRKGIKVWSMSVRGVIDLAIVRTGYFLCKVTNEENIRYFEHYITSWTLNTTESFMKVHYLNLYASGFKCLQSTFAYGIIFAGHLNFSTWFTKNVNILGTKIEWWIKRHFLGNKTEIFLRVFKKAVIILVLE